MRAKDFRLQNLPHDLYHAIQHKIADGKEGVSSGKEINCARPKNEPTAEEGQCINDGNEDAQKQGVRRVQHQQPDERDDKDEAHQNELRFDIAPDGSLQLLLGGVNGKPEQRGNVAVILLTNEVSVLSEEIGGKHRNEKCDEKAGDTAKLSRCLACRDKGEQKAGGICLQIGKDGLQTLGQPLGIGVKLCPEV